MQISKRFTFESSHQLPDEPCYGKCSRLHGHSYKLLVVVEGSINDKGWVCNFSDVKKIVNELAVDKLDHYHLNDVIAGVTTAENIVQWIANQIQEPIKKETGATLTKLTLHETETCFVEHIL